MNWRDTTQPPVFWHRQLREAGTDYPNEDLPGAQERSSTSFEMVWNWTVDNPRAMEQIAEALHLAATSDF
jgi:hypothetical protein